MLIMFEVYVGGVGSIGDFVDGVVARGGDVAGVGVIPCEKCMVVVRSGGGGWCWYW